MKSVILKKEKFEESGFLIYKKSQKAGKMRISIRSKDVFITIPPFVSLKSAEKFVLENKEWIIDKIKKQKQRKIFLGGNEEEYLRLKNLAFQIIFKKVKYFNRFYNFKYQKISIKNQKTRWGSCSCLGNLNFNYKVIFLPEELLDYIVVHELCHLKEMNHSKKFWKLVEKNIPDYKLKIKKLKNI